MVTKWVSEYLFEPPVQLEGSTIVFVGQNYEVEISEIKDSASLLEWVVHLSEKTWTTGRMIGGFVEVVCEAKGWPLRAAQ
jgi:hypothetical protein